jgi:hypothetical protein
VPDFFHLTFLYTVPVLHSFVSLTKIPRVALAYLLQPFISSWRFASFPSFDGCYEDYVEALVRDYVFISLGHVCQRETAGIRM